MALREGRSYYSAKRLFAELCRTHGLDWPHRRLLGKLAHAHAPRNPAQVFLEPGWFEAADVPLALRPFHQELGELKQQLFGNPSS